MNPAETIVSKLNELLDADHFDVKLFDSSLNSLKELCNPSIKFLNFKYFDEKLLRKLKGEKIKLVKSQDFENAARLREQEKECQNYIAIRTEYNIERSTYYYDQNYLFYFYLGNARNDRSIKKILEFD